MALQKLNYYKTLKHSVVVSGLLIPQPRYYLIKALTNTILLSITILLLAGPAKNFGLVFSTGLFFSLVFVQIALLGHDIAHYQVFHSKLLSKLANLVNTNLILGLSDQWWQDQHNRHHSYPNDIEQDPSINLSLISFAPEQFKTKNRFQKFFIYYQTYLYFPLMFLVVIHMRIYSTIYLIQNKKPGYIFELSAIILHWIVYIYFVFSNLSLQQGLIFTSVYHAFAGLYMGIIFAPNHKGMPIVKRGDNVELIIRQVITSRNIRSNRLIDFVYGGLNYQIEHHLFPMMPRNNLKKARLIVKNFCLSNQIPYHETSLLDSFREIIQYLKKESSPLPDLI